MACHPLDPLQVFFTQSTPIKRLIICPGLDFSTVALLTLGARSLLRGHRLCCRALGSLLGQPQEWMPGKFSALLPCPRMFLDVSKICLW